MSEEAKKFDYFASPDGEDVFPKMWEMAKVAGTIGFGVSTMEVLLKSYKQGYMYSLGRYGVIGVPILAMGLAFTAASNVSGSIRKKDDVVNWVIGGAVSASVLGACSKSKTVGFFTAIGLGYAAGLKKYAVMNNWVLMWKPVKRGRSLNSPKFGYSFVADRPGNWVRSLDK